MNLDNFLLILLFYAWICGLAMVGALLGDWLGRRRIRNKRHQMRDVR